MRRARLAPAFVTAVVSGGCAWALSGCAWTLGGGAQYTHTGQAQNAVAVVGRAAWGFGHKRNALVIAADLATGASPSHGSFWIQSMPRLEYAWLPRRGRAGLRLGAGWLIASGVDASRVNDFVGGPAVAGEVLYGLTTSNDDGENSGYRAVLLGLGLHVAYDVAGAEGGPVVVIAASVTHDGVLPFGNPRPTFPQVPVRPVMQVATDPAP